MWPEDTNTNINTEYHVQPQRLFAASFILPSKLTFDNLLNSVAVIKTLLSGILFSISVAFALRAAVVTNPVA